jgi:hypothetical protein
MKTDRINSAEEARQWGIDFHSEALRILPPQIRHNIDWDLVAADLKSESPADEGLSEVILDSLRRVLEYIGENERNDFESSPDVEREQHIYRDVHTIKTWFEGVIKNREADEG